MEEETNKSQRTTRKRSNKWFAIFKGKFGNYENILSPSCAFIFFVTLTVNIFLFCYIYVN